MDRLKALVLVSAAAIAPRADAQPVPEYPAKPVRVVVGQAPGGGNDIQTRIFAQKLTDAFGRAFVVENRTGSGSVLAYRTVASSAPDGYTLLGATSGFTIAPAVHASPGYDPSKDVAKLGAELAKGAKAPDVTSRLAPDGGEPVGSSPEQLRQFIVGDIARWRKVVKDAGIKLD